MILDNIYCGEKDASFPIYESYQQIKRMAQKLIFYPFINYQGAVSVLP